MRDRDGLRLKLTGRVRALLFALPILNLTFVASGFAQTGASAPASSPESTQPAAAKSLEDWRAVMRQNRPPKKGCFTSAYPSQEWQKVPCTTAPARPYLPARGPRVVGGGGINDASAQVTGTGTISQAVGSFDSVTAVTSESAAGTANAFSLQLNTNTFTTSVCSGAADTSKCRGWQQFVYSNAAGSAFIQYWLLDYGPGCPAGFISYADQGHLDCFTNSLDAASVPQQDITNLANLSITGFASSGSFDGLLMQVGSTFYVMSNLDSALNLAPRWVAAEFNVFGDGRGSKAVFNSGATIVVRTAVDTASSGVPFCFDESFTAETNNLSFASPPAAEAGLLPAVVFTETTSGSAASPCDAAVPIGEVIPPTPTSPTGTIHTLTPTMTWSGLGSNFNSVEVHILTDVGHPVVRFVSPWLPASASTLVVPSGVLEWGVNYVWQVEACGGPNGPDGIGGCLDNNSWINFSSQELFTLAVAASPSDGGTASGGGTFPAGSTPTITATADSGYVFGSWTDNGQVTSHSASYQLPPLNANESLNANFLKTTRTTLTSAPNPSKFGQAVIFTARVTAPFGIVTFRDGSTTLGTAGLSSFTGFIARFATAKLRPGKHVITATYTGDPAFANSKSAAVVQIVHATELAHRSITRAQANTP